jgi:hypothetical protein
LYGHGLGLVLPVSNLWVAEVAGSGRVAALSLLNFAWGIGAISCSALVLIAQPNGAISVFLYSVEALAVRVAFAKSKSDNLVRLPGRFRAGMQKMALKFGIILVLKRRSDGSVLG